MQLGRRPDFVIASCQLKHAGIALTTAPLIDRMYDPRAMVGVFVFDTSSDVEDYPCLPCEPSERLNVYPRDSI